MNTWDAINSVRVIRDFADLPLSAEHEARILNAARRTGSSKNEQTWAFIVIRDRDHLRELTGVGRYADHLAGAATAVALVTPDESAGWRNTRMWDLGRAAQNMVLAAWELGIGSAPATVFEQELASRLLGLPVDRRCNYLLSFGYPADPSQLTAPKKRGGRKPLEALVHEERW
jgi:nitroreductase